MINQFFRKILIGLSLLSCTLTAMAQAIPAQDIPDNLRAWQPWVLFEHKTASCPFLYNQYDMRLCAWPTQLTLNIESKRATFVQQWQVFNRSWIILPGETAQWPQNVRVNGEPYPVLLHEDKPAVELLAGRYTIEGEIFFDTTPAFLRIPQNTGWVNLTVNGQKNNAPQWNEDGRLWLTAQGETAARSQILPNQSAVRVFRKMIQAVPFEILTLIELDVSKEAELQLGPVNIVGTEPLRIDSPLPAQLDQQGNLRIQARPGTWQVSILSRTLTLPTELKRPTTAEGAWPIEEIWTLATDARLGLMTIGGVPRVDPTQTRLPESWQNLSAYRVMPQDNVEVQQAKATVAPQNHLRLNREMWLDFSGNNYTVKDIISGEMLSQWRLSLLSPMILGHVQVNGMNQLITVEEDKQGQPVLGVELRHGRVLLEAVSQVGQHVILPATGWNQDFDSARIRLHLPPGWQLLTALGVDKISASWLSNFTLFDIFMIAIISAAVSLLLGKRWGLLTAVMFLLIYPMPYAPRWLWLNIAIVLMLLPWLPRVLQKGGQVYRDLSLIALTACTAIFCLMALRVAIFPQLNAQSPHIVSQLMLAVAEHAPDFLKQSGEHMFRGKEGAGQDIFAKKTMETAPATQAMARDHEEQLPPELTTPVDAKTQTGPALPTWEGTVVNLSWSGPVAAQQTMRLFLISPITTRLLAVLQVALTVLLCVQLWRIREEKISVLQSLFKSNAPKMMVCLMAGFLSMMTLPLKTKANDYPPPDILQTLEQRLLVAPSCLPHCASIASAQLTMAQDNTFKLELQMETTEDVAVPIPRGNKSWQISQVLLDRQIAPGVASEPAQLLLQLPAGVHRVAIVGQAMTSQINVDFPLKPYQIIINATGWQADGVVGRQLQGTGLVLKRSGDIVQTETATKDVTFDIPAFVIVTRRLNLGLNATIETQVQRLSQTGDAIHIEIPLLPHESVITQDTVVHNGRVQVNLAPTQLDMTWQSTLAHFTDLTLLAPKTNEWVEVWQLNIDAKWHAMITGILPLAETSYQTWEPMWWPWPGESVHVQLMRLPAANGATVTIDNAELLNRVGSQSTDSVLSLNMRTTLGGQQRIVLPQGASVKMLSVNGLTQVPVVENNELRVTLVPGDNALRLRFDSPFGANLLTRGSALEFGLPIANLVQGITLPKDRWVWVLGGSGVGPAMIFWGMVLLLVLASIILSQTKWLPLKTWQLLLVGLGMVMISPIVAIIWLVLAVLLGWRTRQTLTPTSSVWIFRAQQIGWAALLAIALLSTAFFIHATLAEKPSAWILPSHLPQSALADWVWFQDIAVSWPRIWVISTPLWVYRIIILVWSLGWVFFLLRSWPWVWNVLTQQGIWEPKRR